MRYRNARNDGTGQDKSECHSHPKGPESETHSITEKGEVFAAWAGIGASGLLRDVVEILGREVARVGNGPVVW
jgi:hypothetical protein